MIIDCASVCCSTLQDSACAYSTMRGYGATVARDSRSEGWEFESLCPYIQVVDSESDRMVCVAHQDARLRFQIPLPSCPCKKNSIRNTDKMIIDCASVCCSTLRDSACAYSTMRGYGATVARLTPDQKVGRSNLSVSY